MIYCFTLLVTQRTKWAIYWLVYVELNIIRSQCLFLLIILIMIIIIIIIIIIILLLLLLLLLFASLEPGDFGFPDIKTGINLPKSDDEWITPKEYFKSVLFFNPSITAQNLSWSIKLLNDTIYDYFSANLGQVAQTTDESLIKSTKTNLNIIWRNLKTLR